MRQIQPAPGGVAFEQFVGEVGDVFHQALERVAAGPHRPNDFFKRAHGLIGSLGDFLNVHFQLGGVPGIGLGQPAQEGNARQGGTELIMQVFLPPLIFEAAIQIRWQPFKREFPLLLMLVTIGVALAAALVAAAMHFMIGWGWLAAAFFGIMRNAPTDAGP